MFAKLKKKIAEEAATAPRSGVRIPRTISKESITSVGADSGDDFASDGSSSRDDLSAQLLRRNHQIRKLEAKLSDYAEQLRIMQKTKEKLEIALERHQDSSIKKLQEQSESHQANRTKMAEGMAVALEKKDQEWMEKLAALEREKSALSAQLEEMMKQSLTLFQKRDDLDELDGFQQQELAKVKHMLLRKEELLGQQEQELQQKEVEVEGAKQGLSEVRGQVQALQRQLEKSCRLNSELQSEREELLLLQEEDEQKVSELEARCQELQSVIQQVSEDFQMSQNMVATLEKSLRDLQAEHDALKVQQQKAAVTEEDKERLLVEFQKKVSSLERRLQGNLSQDEHLQELLQEKSSLEMSLENTRAELLSVRTNHADTVSSLEAQIANLEQQVLESSEKLKRTEQMITEEQQSKEKLRGEWTAEKAFLDQQLCLLEQQSQEKVSRLEGRVSCLQTDKWMLQDRLTDLEKQVAETNALLQQRTEELERSAVELNSQLMVSADISRSLDETRRQKEDLQAQVGELNDALRNSNQEVFTISKKLSLREEDVGTLQDEVRCQQDRLLSLQEETQCVRDQLQQMEVHKDSQLRSVREELLVQTQQVDSCQARISYLEVEVETLTEQLQTPEVCEEDQNGSVTVDDLDHIQRINRDLEQQLGDKNRTIKQLQQRLAEMRRTLQKELKLKPEVEAEGKEKPEPVCPEPPSTPAPSPPTSRTTVTNTSDLNDSREINFEYLKHVVLKFMSSRDAEAYQLIRAVSVLLSFTREEEEMLKQTLEYKMSWFGSKPSPKGIIRPSISGASTHWS
ncbi:golgin subfamily A member 1 isoform X4 [Nothobranchius furzeri]|uniref:golgin subfamily A member 1 isoform X4 n=1 Tax=Nothobranchius furzeri TaxID=105023 RepID=UPI003904C872